MSLEKPLVAQDEQACFRALLSKQLVPLVILFVFGWIIFNKVAELDFSTILAEVRDVTPMQWGFAILGAALSFFAIGKMDAVVHRVLNTGVNERAAQLSGVASVATAQLTGFGLLTGTLARWRVLSGISLWKAAQITGAVSVTFMIALGALTAIMILIAPPDVAWLRAIAVPGLLLVLGLMAFTVWKPRWLIRVNLPPLKAQISLAGWALLDTLAAGFALYVLLPQGFLPPIPVFFTVFLMSLGVGLLGTTPGGLGPFEMMMLACFAYIPQEQLLAAIMAYRLVYFALPAVLAGVVLIAGPWLSLSPERDAGPRVQSSSDASRPMALGALAFNAHRAETGLVRQGELDFLVNEADQAISLVAPAGQSLLMLSDPLDAEECTVGTLDALNTAAQQRYLTPCLYKCNARTAVAARRAGWQLLQVSKEAVVNPQSFDLSSRSCRQLRRYLRKAQAEGLCVIEAGHRAPLDEMREIAQAWSAHRKNARGFSMGSFDEDYVTAQRVFLARQNGHLVGFVTFHESWRERSLDLMCYLGNAPAGTTHALIHAAIMAAQEDGVSRLSLAAVPGVAERLTLPKAVCRKVTAMTGSEGLQRFKAAFAPRWEPLYLAAPTQTGLAFAGIDLVDRITRPRINMSPTS